MVRQLFDGVENCWTNPINEFHFVTRFSAIGNPALRSLSYPKRLDVILEDKWLGGHGHNPETWNDVIDRTQFQQMVRADDVNDDSALFVSLLRNMARCDTKFDGDPEQSRYVAKGVQQETYFEDFLKIAPGIKLIYVLRNPYGCFNASVNQTRFHRLSPSDQEYVGRNIKRLNEKCGYPLLEKRICQLRNSYAAALRYSQSHPKQFYILNYDKLCQDVATETAALANFCELPHSEAMTQVTSLHGKQFHSRKGWTAAGSDGKHNAGVVSTDGVMKWVEQLPQNAKAIVTYQLKDEIRALGFDVHDIEPNPSIGFVENDDPAVRKANLELLVKKVA